MSTKRAIGFQLKSNRFFLYFNKETGFTGESLPLEGKGDRRTAVDEVVVKGQPPAMTGVGRLRRLHLISQPNG